MAIEEYGIGGNIVDEEANEGIAQIPENRTIFVNQFTDEEPILPDVVTGLTSSGEVFKHFNPNVDVTFEDKEGQSVMEHFEFNNVADFAIKAMTEQSPFLNQLSTDKEFYEKAMKSLRSNKPFQRAVADKNLKEAMLIILKELHRELAESV